MMNHFTSCLLILHLTVLREQKVAQRLHDEIWRQISHIIIVIMMRIFFTELVISRLYGDRTCYYLDIPFPADVVILALIIILINICRKKVLFMRFDCQNGTHLKGWKGLFESLFQLVESSPVHGSSIRKRSRSVGLVKYYCMSYGKENNGIICSKCDSKWKEQIKVKVYYFVRSNFLLYIITPFDALFVGAYQALIHSWTSPHICRI